MDSKASERMMMMLRVFSFGVVVLMGLSFVPPIHNAIEAQGTWIYPAAILGLFCVCIMPVVTMHVLSSGQQRRRHSDTGEGEEEKLEVSRGELNELSRKQIEALEHGKDFGGYSDGDDSIEDRTQENMKEAQGWQKLDPFKR